MRYVDAQRLGCGEIGDEFEFRWLFDWKLSADGDQERMPLLADELVRLKQAGGSRF